MLSKKEMSIIVRAMRNFEIEGSYTVCDNDMYDKDVNIKAELDTLWTEKLIKESQTLYESGDCFIPELTERGIKVGEVLLERLEKLKEWTLIAERKNADPEYIKFSEFPWSRGKFKEEAFITNGRIWTFAKPYMPMKVPKVPNAGIGILVGVKEMVKLFKKKAIPIVPKLWRVVENFDEMEQIQFCSDNNENHAIMDACFFDFINSRYQSTTYHIVPNAEDRVGGGKIIAVTVKNRLLLNGIIAFIAPIKEA